MITIELPIRTVNSSNVREHWAVRAKRTKAHRQATRLVVLARWRVYGYDAEGCRQLLNLGLSVLLIRVAPKRLDAHDGLPTSLKACVDGVAEALGLLSDADPRVSWMYAQRTGRQREYAVRIIISPRGSP